jgi:pimeloyl-ACP methyl ester carboxylesterase
VGLFAPVRVDQVASGSWRLEVRRYDVPATRDRRRRPVVMIPGYAMNTHVLAYHPRGRSLVEYLVSKGLDVWTANLRGQGGATGPAGERFGIGELVLDDLPAVLEHVKAVSGTEQVDVIGCSLGGSLVYAWLAHHPHDHGIGNVVTIGAPLRWESVHPLLRAAFISGRLAGIVPIRGTRLLANQFLPYLRRLPGVLSIYMNPAHVDLSAIPELVETVDDPVPWINRQMARWIQQRDLVVRGVNVTTGLAPVDGVRILAIIANRDGIVPPDAARAITQAYPAASTLAVGDKHRWYAHADMFVGDHAEQDVFEPLAAFLENRPDEG